MLAHDHARLLVFGPALWRAAAGRSGHEPVVVAELPDDEAAVSTTVLDWADLGPCRLHRLPAPGISSAVAPPLLTPSLRPSSGWAALAEQCWPGQQPLPLLLMTRAGDTVHAHGLVRLGAERAVFARLGACGTVDSDDETVDVSGLVAAGLDLAEQHRLGLSNHECARHDLRPGVEVEHKLTLLSPVDLHGVLADLREQIAAGPAWHWDHGRDWQWWDFDNRVFDVPDGPEAGYVSFIPATEGTIVKRKWFAQDQVARGEQRWRVLDVGPGEYEHYLRTVMGVEGAQDLGAFRRVRLDTDLEVRATGNVHSIMLDWCRPYDGGEHLWQIEVEYLHTRTTEPSRSTAGESIEAELDQLGQLVRDYLHRRDLPYSQPGESKRTWLRRLAAQRQR